MLKTGHSLPRFLLFSSFLQTVNMFSKNCRWPDSNPGPLVLEATTLPTAPQPKNVVRRRPSKRLFLAVADKIIVFRSKQMKVPIWLVFFALADQPDLPFAWFGGLCNYFFFNCAHFTVLLTHHGGLSLKGVTGLPDNFSIQQKNSLFCKAAFLIWRYENNQAYCWMESRLALNI